MIEHDVREKNIRSAGSFFGRLRKGLICLVLLLLSAQPVYAQPEENNVRISTVEEQEGIGLNLYYGYQNTAKSGRFLPVTMEIVNHTEADISGRLELFIPEADCTLNYSFAADVSAGETAELRETISVTQNARTASMRLYDESGNLLAEKQADISIQGSTGEILIGILSNTPQELSYFRGLNINVETYTLRTRTVTLNPADFPATAEGFSQLDVILISNYTMSRLSPEMVRVIYDWTEGGGTLLIGTGSMRNPLGGIADYLEDVEVSPAETKDVDMGLKYSTDTPDGARLTLSVSEVSAPEGIQAMQSEELAVLTTFSAGSGVIGICAFDLCDIREFCIRETDYPGDMLRALLGSARLLQLSSPVGEGGGNYAALRELTDVLEYDRLPDMSVYLVIAVLYVLLAGPGAYLLLRQKGLGSYYSLAVLLLSAAAAGAIWFAGLGKRFEAPSVEYAVIQERSGGKLSETEIISFSSPFREDVRLSVSGDYVVQPVMPDTPPAEADESLAEALFGGTNRKKQINISMLPENHSIEEKNTEPFEGQIFELHAGRDEEETSSELEVDLQYFDEVLSGTVTNHGSRNYTDAALLMYGRIILIGDLAAGQTKDLSGYTAVYGPTGAHRLTAEYITGLSRFGETAQDSEAYVRASACTRLLLYYLEETLGNYYSGGRLVAFDAEQKSIPNSILTEGIECYGTTLVAQTVTVNAQQGDELYRSALSGEPKLISGSYEAGSNTTDGTTPLILEYALGTDITVTALRLNGLSEEFSGKTAKDGQTLIPFRGTRAFYNYRTSSYDMLSSQKTSWNSEEIAPYLSPSNTITVRYIPDENEAEGSRMFLPVPMVTGSENG
ncbi:MAG: hypothetical protein Q4C63_00680 [Eubacteriales bacterium]|nr:hypothetical protein [Eubacteriales bacterium]